jgi:hypothetical protein
LWQRYDKCQQDLQNLQDKLFEIVSVYPQTSDQLLTLINERLDLQQRYANGLQKIHALIGDHTKQRECYAQCSDILAALTHVCCSFGSVLLDVGLFEGSPLIDYLKNELSRYVSITSQIPTPIRTQPQGEEEDAEEVVRHKTHNHFRRRRHSRRTRGTFRSDSRNSICAQLRILKLSKPHKIHVLNLLSFVTDISSSASSASSAPTNFRPKIYTLCHYSLEILRSHLTSDVSSFQTRAKSSISSIRQSSQKIMSLHKIEASTDPNTIPLIETPTQTEANVNLPSKSEKNSAPRKKTAQ